MTDLLPIALPAWLTPQLMASALVIVIVLHVALGAAAYGIWLERKLSAWVQDRVGPNRVGPFGLLQPIADGLKLITKEEFRPRGVDVALFSIAPFLSVIPAMVGIAAIPWAGGLDLSAFGLEGVVRLQGADFNLGIVFLLASASLGVYGVTLGGWASNSKYSFFGGLRAGAQMISYEIPMGICLLCVVLAAGTLRMDEVIRQQTDHGWFLLHMPLPAIMFYICMLAEANRAPFDLAEAESELVGGWHTEYSSMKWASFFLAEYIHVFVGSAFFAVIFMGGWSVNPLPFGPDLPDVNPANWEALGAILLPLIQFGVLMGKVVLMVALTMMVRGTLPRLRFDQLMRLAWEGLIPASLVCLLVTSAMVYFGMQEFMFIGGLASIALVLLGRPFLPRDETNRRIGMIGSRFSPVSA